MKVSHIIGADLSKETIDFASHQAKKHLKVANTSSGFRDLIKWLKTLKIDVSQVMIVMEHTGFYSYHLEHFLHQHAISFTKVSALAIKRSMGLVRGKTDKQDAKRIAQYGSEKVDRLTPAQPISQNMHRLQILHSARERFVRNRASLLTAVKEQQEVLGLKKSDIIISTQLLLIKSYDLQINKLEDEIALIIQEEKSLNENYTLLQSIKGVGKVVALATIIKTENFTKFSNPRKFACFCGVAPFETSSGTSIRGATRVSPLADKTMKTLLDLAAKTAIQHDKELREYYIKRTTNGKSKMSTINVVRNKILYRMFAIIKRQTPYEPLRTAA